MAFITSFHTVWLLYFFLALTFFINHFTQLVYMFALYYLLIVKMTEITCHPIIMKISANILKNISNPSVNSLFSHTHSFTPTLYIYIISNFSILLSHATANLLSKSFQIFTQHSQLYSSLFVLFTFFPHSLIHPCIPYYYFTLTILLPCATVNLSFKSSQILILVT